MLYISHIYVIVGFEIKLLLVDFWYVWELLIDLFYAITSINSHLYLIFTHFW